MDHKCPHCGTSLPEQAAFCPSCAQSVKPRREITAPKPILGKVLHIGIPLLIACAVALSIFLYTRPRTYDSGDAGQVFYSAGGVEYQLLLNQSQEDRYTPLSRKEQAAELDGSYRTPVRLYINRVSDGADATAAFMENVASVTAEVAQLSADCPPPVDMIMTEPAPSDFFPDAALVCFLDFPGQAGEWELRWTITMKNGDTILLRQVENIYIITIYHVTPEDAPMGTIGELQALVDQIGTDSRIAPKDRVYLHLPPATYDGGLVMDKRAINLVGSADEAGNRTTFTDAVRVSPREDWMSYIDDVDFVGNGGKLGVSGSARLQLTNCRISGWETGVLAYSQGWINLDACRVENNQVGFHFNSAGGTPMDSIYENNTFTNNGTAVLLEQFPADTALDFVGSRFAGNGTDIDNRCGQEMELSEAVFE